MKYTYLDVGYPGAPYETARAVAYLRGVFPVLITARELVRVIRALRAPSEEATAA